MGYVLSIDTETVSKTKAQTAGMIRCGMLPNSDTDSFTSGKFVFDIGWQINDNKGNAIVSRNYLVAEVYNNRKFFPLCSYFYRNNLPFYENAVANGNMYVLPLWIIKSIFVNDIKKYHIHKVWAYNASFDRDVLNNTMALVYHKAKSFTPNNVKWACIMRAANQTFMKSRNYIKYTTNNGLIAKKGLPSTSAETAYRYIAKDNGFIESHTALDDAQIEMIILQKALRYHKKMDVEPKRNSVYSDYYSYLKML